MKEVIGSLWVDSGELNEHKSKKIFEPLTKVHNKGVDHWKNIQEIVDPLQQFEEAQEIPEGSK